MQNPVFYAIPLFLVMIGIEAVTLRHDVDRDRTGYSGSDTQMSLFMGAVSLVFLLLFKVVTLALFTILWVHMAPWHLPTDSWWTWLLLLVAVDLTWYCNHRFSHRVRVGWAGHRAHHSSEAFNLGTALRLKWNPWSEALFWAPLPLLGFAPWTIYTAYGFNMIYQFFLHTELVDRLPRPIEFVFNTPAHHRIHHSREPEHFDTNYGGMLIIWDRLFGTFMQSSTATTYGLAGLRDSHNLALDLQYGEYRRIMRDVRHADHWRHKLGYAFGPPGWKHDDVGLAQTEKRRPTEQAPS
jgi:sterol desaturase/sphingolipid hydroxylase (fatty acid hydroxylase superfamily)